MTTSICVAGCPQPFRIVNNTNNMNNIGLLARLFRSTNT
jgi:hypothetical protein